MADKKDAKKQDIKKLVRWATKKRKGGSRKWKTKWVSVSRTAAK